MKNLIGLILIAFVSMSATWSNGVVVVRTDGLYSSKVINNNDSSKTTEYHFIKFSADGKAKTYILPTNDAAKAASLAQSSAQPNFAGEYRIHENNVVYRSNNSIDKTTAPRINLFTLYNGTLEQNGTINFTLNFTNGSSNTATFEFQPFK